MNERDFEKAGFDPFSLEVVLGGLLSGGVEDTVEGFERPPEGDHVVLTDVFKEGK